MRNAGLLLFYLLIFEAHAQGVRRAEPQLLTLREAFKLARQHHPSLEQASSSVNEAKARAAIADGERKPVVRGSASYRFSFSDSSSAGVSLSPSGLNGNGAMGLDANQLLYDFGRSAQAGQAAAYFVISERYREQSIALAVSEQVGEAYFQAISALSNASVAAETVAQNQKRTELVAGLVENGRRPEIDLIQAKMELANANFQRIEQENQAALAKARLSKVIGLDAMPEYQLNPDLAEEMVPLELNKPMFELVEIAVKNHPELAALEQQVAAQDLLLAASEKGLYPILSATSALSSSLLNSNQSALTAAAGIALQWPLYEGGIPKAREQQEHAALVKVKSQLRAYRLELHLQVEQALLAAQSAHASIAAAEEVLVLAKERYRLADARYNSGTGTMIELGDAQVSLTQALSQRILARSALQTAVLRFKIALGQLPEG